MPGTGPTVVHLSPRLTTVIGLWACRGLLPLIWEALLVDVRVLFDERVAMRDGVLLSADVFLPSVGDSFPVVLCRTLYSKESNPGTDGARPDGYVGWGMRFVEAGYGFVIQDVRGRYDSDGVWEVYVQAEDGHDTVEWLGAQSWCDGNVGMCGISYVGSLRCIRPFWGASI